MLVRFLIRFLMGAAALALCGASTLAAPPQIALNAGRYEVTVSPGATVAYLYAAGPGKHGGGSVTDSDLDGRVAIDPGVAVLPHDRGLVVVDVASGEYASESPTAMRGLGERAILRGPAGEFTELVHFADRPLVLWVRPGVGAWAPPSFFLQELDGSDLNKLAVGSVTNFETAAGPSARPPGFAAGDLLFLITETASGPVGGLVDANLALPANGGFLTFHERYGPAVVEGNDIVLTVFRLFGTDGTATVRCCAVTGTASPGIDFVPLNDIVTFGPGETVKRVHLKTVNDALWAQPRSLTAQLAAPTGALLYSATWRSLTIVDDEPEPVLSVEGLPATVTETDEAQTIEATVIVTNPRRDPLIVHYSAGTSGTLTFAPAENRKTFTFTIPGDDVARPDYTRRVELAPLGASQTLRHDVRVVDDELPSLTIANARAQEGATIAMNVAIEPFTPPAARFRWTTSDGTAKAGQDYVAASGVFQPGASWQIRLLPDDAAEGEETFYVDVTDVQGLTPVTTRVAITVQDDDDVPPPQFAESRVIEGNGYTTNRASARLTLAVAPSFPITYRVTSRAGTATPWTDFDPVSEVVTFQAGQTEAGVPLSITADEYPEEDETFTLSVEGTNSTGVVTIVDDDDGETPTLTVSDGSVLEGTGSRNGSVILRVSLSAPATHDIWVEFDVLSGTASYSDFYFRRGTMHIRPGVTALDFPIEIVADALIEGDEQFTFVLSNPAGVILSRTVATVTIVDDDKAKRGKSRSVRH